jgi:hypothetical protein
MKPFIAPARCTEKSVNAALQAAGIDADIYRDASNDWRYTVRVGVPGEDRWTEHRTTANTPRAAVEWMLAENDDGTSWLYR